MVEIKLLLIGSDFLYCIPGNIQHHFIFAVECYPQKLKCREYLRLFLLCHYRRFKPETKQLFFPHNSRPYDEYIHHTIICLL